MNEINYPNEYFFNQQQNRSNLINISIYFRHNLNCLLKLKVCRGQMHWCTECMYLNKTGGLNRVVGDGVGGKERIDQPGMIV